MPFGDIVGHEKPKIWMRAALRQGRLAHAYLFSGEPAIGKRFFAVRLAQALACDAAEQVAEADACGRCRSCQQIENLTHPDFLYIEPEQDKANPQISIDRVRDIEHHVMYRPFCSSHKICLIDAADLMTVGAANALLKTLEEPPDHSLFFLISSRPQALPSTVRSRCLAVPFSPLSHKQVEGALTLKRALPPDDARFLSLATQGRIGQALNTSAEEARKQQAQALSLLMSASRLSISEIMDKADTLPKEGQFQETLSWLASGLRDMLLAGVGTPREHIVNEHHLVSLTQLGRQAGIPSLLTIIEEFFTLESASKRNLNMQLGLESFFLNVQQAMSARTP